MKEFPLQIIEPDEIFRQHATDIEGSAASVKTAKLEDQILISIIQVCNPNAPNSGSTEVQALL
jgi:hypothetical protein